MMKISIKCEIPVNKNDILTVSTSDIGNANVYVSLSINEQVYGAIIDVYDLEEAVTKCREALEESTEVTECR